MTSDFLKLENLKQQADQNLSIPQNIELLSDKQPYTPELLRALYPRARRIFVLDFLVEFDGACEHILGPNGEILGLKTSDNGTPILNIDHHSLHESFDHNNISTTHQCLIANQIADLQPTAEDVILVNHIDTDGVLAILALANPCMHPKLRVAFAHTAIAADHTGAGGIQPLVTLIDSLYPQRDLRQSLEIVMQALHQGGIDELPKPVQAKYSEELQRRERVRQVIDNNEFEVVGKDVILIRLPEGEYMQTITIPALLAERGITCSVVIIANPMDGKFRLNVRSGRDFPQGFTLQQLAVVLDLARYGYGGRAHAGGNSRGLGTAELITPVGFAELIASGIADYSQSSY